MVLTNDVNHKRPENHHPPPAAVRGRWCFAFLVLFTLFVIHVVRHAWGGRTINVEVGVGTPASRRQRFHQVASSLFHGDGKRSDWPGRRSYRCAYRQNTRKRLISTSNTILGGTGCLKLVYRAFCVYCYSDNWKKVDNAVNKTITLQN